MKKNIKKNQHQPRLETLIQFFKTLKNPRKRGELSEMLEKDDFHNRNMTEEEYQQEQKEWLEKVKRKKKSD